MNGYDDSQVFGILFALFLAVMGFFYWLVEAGLWKGFISPFLPFLEAFLELLAAI